MGVIKHHIFGIRVTVQSLLQGKYLKYFIPGVIAALIYLYIHFSMNAAKEASANATEDIPLIGGAVSWFSTQTLTFVETLLKEALKFLVLILLSPFNCLLSEKMDTDLTGQTFSGGLIRMINDLLRTILIVIFALVLEYLFLGLWVILSFIFPDSWGPVVTFFISSFFFGFAFYDFSLERYGVGNLSSWGFAFSKMGYMIVTGALFTGLMNLPFEIGVFIAPVLITMVSTATYVRMKGLTLPTA